LTLDNEKIVEMLESLDKESRAIKSESLRMSWFMRGGLQYEDAMLLSSQEREIVGEIIKDHMKQTKDSGLPFF
jgi:hypothetical protein